jgi:hypothetical protein
VPPSSCLLYSLCALTAVPVCFAPHNMASPSLSPRAVLQQALDALSFVATPRRRVYPPPFCNAAASSDTRTKSTAQITSSFSCPTFPDNAGGNQRKSARPTTNYPSGATHAKDNATVRPARPASQNLQRSVSHSGIGQAVNVRYTSSFLMQSLSLTCLFIVTYHLIVRYLLFGLHSVSMFCSLLQKGSLVKH